MSEQNTTNTKGPFVGVTSDVTKPITEKAIDKLLNGVLDFVDTQFKHAKISLRTVYKMYLNNAFKRYNSVTTLVNRYTPRPIKGKNNIYVHANLSYKGKTIETYSANPLFEISNNILICGTGGIGKTMMLRYFFLNEIGWGNKIPILLTLRKVNNTISDNISFIDIAYMCMDDFNVKLPRDQFEYSLEKGIYLFLLDGLDEVVEAKASKVAEEIQRFCGKYPDNYYIITSRPGFNFNPLETFTRVDTEYLSKEQAILLARKFANSEEEDDRVEEFCKQLEEYLFNKYQSFASVPLLLSMMYLTFLDSGSIPNNIADFYERTFDALINTHDNFKKPNAFTREFKCKGLDRRMFKNIFAHFCYRSFFETKEHGKKCTGQSHIDSIYEFSPEDIEKRLSVSIKKMGANVSADNYLLDLQRIVCLIVQDGPVFRFVHRSFQDYFAAVYTEQLDDDKQKIVFLRTKYHERYNDFYKILYSLQKSRLITNGFLEEVKNLIPILKENNVKDAWRDYFFRGYFYNDGKGYYCLQRKRNTYVDHAIAYVLGISDYDIRHDNDTISDLLVNGYGYYFFSDVSFNELEQFYPNEDWNYHYEDMAKRNSFEQLSSTVLAWDEEYNSKTGISEEYFPD